MNDRKVVEGVESRAAALRVVTGVDRGGRSDRLLDTTLSARRMTDVDRRLVTEIVYGSLRRQATLDRSLQPFCRRPIDELDRPTRGALRIAAYQCGYLDTVPNHAAVHATVEALKRLKPRAVPFGNAVLRAWLRGGAILDPGDGSWGDRFDVPAWLARRWQERHGPEAERWFEAALRPAPRALHVHPRAADPDEVARALARDGVTTEPSELARDCLRVVDGNPALSDPWKTGAVSPRGEAALMVADLVAPGAGWVLDACCGRGGKALRLAERGDRVLGLDLDRGRLLAARTATARAGVTSLHLARADVGDELPTTASFDRILVDAPCSGLGTLRRHPEIKWRASEEQLHERATEQRRILRGAAAALSPAGALLYVTCSTEPEENEQVVDAVLSTDPRLERWPLESTPAGAIDEIGDLRTAPGEVDLDGFYAARIRRRDGV